MDNRQKLLIFIALLICVFVLFDWPLVVVAARIIMIVVSVLAIIGIVVFGMRWRAKRKAARAAAAYAEQMAALDLSERQAQVAQEWLKVGVIAHPQNHTVFTRNAPGGPLQQIYPRTAIATMVEGPAAASFAMPEAPPWREVKDLITSEEHIILGWQDGPVYGSIKDLLSTGVIGKPGRGKTTALLFYIAELVVAGATITIMDPHGSLNSLRDVLDYATGRDMEKAIARLEQDLDKHLGEYEDGQRTQTPCLALIDEFAMLSKRYPHLRDVVERVILEGRKVNMYLIISSQAFMAKDFGGSTARDNLSSRVVFYSRESQARILGLESEAIDTLLPALKGQIGRAILDCDSRDEPELIAIPLTTSDDIAEVVRRSGRSRPETFGNVSQNTANHAKNGIFIEPETFGDLSESELLIIKNMMGQHQSRRQIAEQLKRTGRGYQSLKAYFDQAGYKKDPLNS